VNEIEIEAAHVGQSSFDIDAVTDADLTEPLQAASPVTMADLDRVIKRTGLLQPAIEAAKMVCESMPFGNLKVTGESDVPADGG
jgi:hypothetical protein